MIQNIIVAVILIFVAVYVIRAVIKSFSKNRKTNKCNGCTGCELANQLKNNCSQKDIEANTL